MPWSVLPRACSSRPVSTRVSDPGGASGPVVTGAAVLVLPTWGAFVPKLQRVQCRLRFLRGGCLAGGECAALDQLVASVRKGPSLGLGARVRVRRCPGDGCRVGDGARVRGVPCAPFLARLEGLPGPHRRCAWQRVRFARPRCAGSVPRRPGGPESALRRRGGPTPHLHHRRRAVARRGLRAGASVRRAPSRGVGRADLRGARTESERRFEGLPELVVSGLDDGDARDPARDGGGRSAR